MDIVYLVKNSPINEELTYSLRSLVNLPHHQVFVVGGCPANLNRDKIIYVPTLQGGNKYKNTTLSLKTVCQDSRLSGDFILMNDDFFILKPIKDPISELNLCRGTIKEVLEKMRTRHNTDGPYMTSMHQTDVYLQDIGVKTPLSYELHIPIVFNKTKFLDVFSLPYITDSILAHKRSVYGNLYFTNSVKIDDVKVYRDFETLIGSDKFLSTEDISWPKVKPHIHTLFSNKSIYEL